MNPAVVKYLPKSKADKKKSLLKNSEDSNEGLTIPEVHLCFLYLYLCAYAISVGLFYGLSIKSFVSAFNA